eukprot:Sspe_Gene.118697::Locus_112791_Transcript_2_2_Confidence_0.857_Length_474::g.118697::m.118697
MLERLLIFLGMGLLFSGFGFLLKGVTEHPAITFASLVFTLATEVYAIRVYVGRPRRSKKRTPWTWSAILRNFAPGILSTSFLSATASTSAYIGFGGVRHTSLRLFLRMAACAAAAWVATAHLRKAVAARTVDKEKVE